MGAMTEAAGSLSHDELVAAMTGGMARSDLPAFAGSERLRPDGRPRPEFRAQIRRIPNAINALTVVATSAAAVAVVAAVIAVDHWLATAVAVPVMGVVMLRMFILHHEAAHRLLFSNRVVNDVVGVHILGWLPFGTGTHHYRRGHVNHHRDEFGPKEPDFLLYSFYPVPQASMRRKLLRDLLGVSAYRIVKPRFTGLVRPRFLVLSLRFFAGQALVFGAFWAAGHPWLYAVLWALPYFTYYQVANRLRAIAEHGGMTRTPRPPQHHPPRAPERCGALVPSAVQRWLPPGPPRGLRRSGPQPAAAAASPRGGRVPAPRGDLAQLRLAVAGPGPARSGAGSSSVNYRVPGL